MHADTVELFKLEAIVEFNNLFKTSLLRGEFIYIYAAYLYTK